MNLPELRRVAMRAPDDDASQFAVFSLQRDQIPDAAFVQAATVVDYQNFAGLRALHCFQKNIDTPKMSDRQRRARETLIGGHRPNARRTDSERNLQAQSGVGDERSRKIGKSARYRLRLHAATLLEFDWLCKRIDRKAEGLFRFAPDYVL